MILRMVYTMYERIVRRARILKILWMQSFRFALRLVQYHLSAISTYYESVQTRHLGNQHTAGSEDADFRKISETWM